MATYEHFVFNGSESEAAEALAKRLSEAEPRWGWGSVRGGLAVITEYSRFNPLGNKAPQLETEEDAESFIAEICDKYRYAAFGVRFGKGDQWFIGAFCKD